MFPLFGLFGLAELIGVGVLLVLLILAALDTFWPATLMAALAVGLYWGGWATAPGWLRGLGHPAYIGLYLVVGMVWVFFKWTRLVEKHLKTKQKAPRWDAHRYDFLAYFVYWPLDMVAYVISDLVRDAWMALSSLVENSFNRYADWRYAKAKASKD